MLINIIKSFGTDDTVRGAEKHQQFYKMDIAFT